MNNPSSNYLAERNNMLIKDIEELHTSEEIFWAQKARANWLQLGDKNIIFFQTQATIRRKRNFITTIQDSNGCLLTETQQVIDQFILDFRKRFTSENVPSSHDINDFLSSIDPCISFAINGKTSLLSRNFECYQFNRTFEGSRSGWFACYILSTELELGKR